MHAVYEQKTELEILIILGPSGVGKSSLGQYLKSSRKWLHLELDGYSGGGIEKLGLKNEWTALHEGADSTPLAKELRKRAAYSGAYGCAITLPSTVVLRPSQLASLEENSIELACLHGSRSDCLSSFKVREEKSNRGLGEEYWEEHNTRLYAALNTQPLSYYVVPAFAPNGARLPFEKIVETIATRKRTRRAVFDC